LRAFVGLSFKLFRKVSHCTIEALDLSWKTANGLRDDSPIFQVEAAALFDIKGLPSHPKMARRPASSIAKGKTAISNKQP